MFIRSMLRGLKGRCPACGEGKLFWRYLKVEPRCGECGATGLRGLLVYMAIYLLMNLGAFAVLVSMRRQGRAVAFFGGMPRRFGRFGAVAG